MGTPKGWDSIAADDIATIRKRDEDASRKDIGRDGFSVFELRAAFNMVADSDDWKNPVKAEIHASLWPIVMLAIEFMTGTKARVTGGTPKGRLLIEAPGYYAGPCN